MSLLNSKYKKSKKIGSGSYGKVYRARDLDNTKLAIKIIEIEDKDGYPSLLESSIMTSLVHPGITPALDVFCENENLYIVQPRAKENLRHWSQSNFVSNSRIKKWCFQLISGLEYMHRHNILHGDIKGRNILFFEKSDVRLADFGLSIFLENSRKGHRGTPTHYAPEMWLDGNWGLKIDVWAMGCTLFEIAYGSNIFPKQEGSKERIGVKFLAYISKFLSKTQSIHYETETRHFEEVKLPSTWKERREFNNFLQSILIWNPKERPSCKDLLLSNYLKDISSDSISSNNDWKRKIKLPIVKSNRDLMEYLPLKSRYKIRDTQWKIATLIFLKLPEHPQTRKVFLACLWISFKLYQRKIDKTLHFLSQRELLHFEKFICSSLSFNLLHFD